MTRNTSVSQGHHERGQILIVTAATLVVLLAIGALVVDLGMSWMLRRQEQNAADPAAIAAAMLYASKRKPKKAAVAKKTSATPAEESKGDEQD